MAVIPWLLASAAISVAVRPASRTAASATLEPTKPPAMMSLRKWKFAPIRPVTVTATTTA